MQVLQKLLGNDELGEETEDIFLPGMETEMEDPRFDYRKCSVCGRKLDKKLDRSSALFGEFLVRNGLICETCGKIYCPACGGLSGQQAGPVLCSCGAKLSLHVLGD